MIGVHPVADRTQAEEQWTTLREDRVAIYRASARASYRAPVRDAFASLLPFETVLDVGCSCGAFMPSILAVNPAAQVMGVDIGPDAIAAAKADWPGHFWFRASMVDWLPLCALSRRFDVVSSGGALACATPADIDAILSAIATIATRGLVLQEVTTTPRFAEGVSTCGAPEWRYDFEKRFEALGWRLVSRVWQQIETVRPAAVMVFRPDKE